MSRTSVNQFLDLNWPNVHDRYLKLIVSIFKFYNNQYPDYFTDVFCPVDNSGVATCCCNKKLELPFNAKSIERRAKYLEQTPQ